MDIRLECKTQKYLEETLRNTIKHLEEKKNRNF